jgi:hypothetical protein
MYKNDEICDKTAPELKAFLKSRGERWVHTYYMKTV